MYYDNIYGTYLIPFPNLTEFIHENKYNSNEAKFCYTFEGKGIQTTRVNKNYWLNAG